MPSELGPSEFLASAIRAYRAHVSGRGPLRNVRCSFERTESCSHYGLRMAETHGALAATQLIAARLKRCHHAVIHAHDGHVYFGALYDQDQAALVSEMRSANEDADTLRAVVEARHAVRAGQLPSAARRVLVRAGRGPEPTASARALAVLAVTGAALILVGTQAESPSTLAGLLTGAGGWLIALLLTVRRRQKRIAWRERLLDLEAEERFCCPPLKLTAPSVGTPPRRGPRAPSL